MTAKRGTPEAPPLNAMHFSFRRQPWLSLALFLHLSPIAHAATLTWQGDVNTTWGSGTSGTNTNWVSNTLPASGDSLVFDLTTAGVSNVSVINDLTSLTLGGTNALSFANDGGTGTGFTLTGNAITLGGNNEDNVLSSPAVGRDGTVYVSSTSGSVYAVRPPAAGGDAVGTLLWSLATGGPCYSSVALAPDGSVVVGSYDQLLWILRPNGTVARRYNTGVPVSSSPAVSADGIAFIGANDLLAINTTDGTLLWRAAVNVDVQNQSPAVGADGTVIVTGIGGVIAVGAGGAGD